MQIPAPCRFVMYHFRGPDSTIRSRPAVITSVNKEELVNLHVFFEPGDGITDHFAAKVPTHDEGPFMPGTWSWPQRYP